MMSKSDYLSRWFILWLSGEMVFSIIGGYNIIIQAWYKGKGKGVEGVVRRLSPCAAYDSKQLTID